MSEYGSFLLELALLHNSNNDYTADTFSLEDNNDDDDNNNDNEILLRFLIFIHNPDQFGKILNYL